jgi:ABC-2 type transport system ATP-binding protein
VRIEFQNIGKRFQGKWLFRHLHLSLESGDRVGITGQNGSGKSTFTQIASGFLSPTEGELKWSEGDLTIGVEDIWKHISWCSPLLELPGSLNIDEVLSLQMKMRDLGGHTHEEMLGELNLEAHAKKKLDDLSSGMIQRLKLLLAFNTKSQLLILDEPASHLDQEWQVWLDSKLATTTTDRLVLIASNHHALELKHCNKWVQISPDGPISADR